GILRGCGGDGHDETGADDRRHPTGMSLRAARPDRDRHFRLALPVPVPGPHRPAERSTWPPNRSNLLATGVEPKSPERERGYVPMLWSTDIPIPAGLFAGYRPSRSRPLLSRAKVWTGAHIRKV